MIEIKGLTKSYKSLVALKNLNLTIEEGDLFGFIGPNGAGKTTTLKILATLLQPDRGDAWIDGWSVKKHGSMVRRAIGYMPDFFGIYDEMKVTEYLDFFGAAYGLGTEERKQVVNDVLELTDLVYKKDDLVQSLSRGMQQRLGLARVLIHDPKVLLLDEPASGLDPRARIEVKALLSELREMGKTIIISSHILSELNELCNKVGIIEKGNSSIAARWTICGGRCRRSAACTSASAATSKRHVWSCSRGARNPSSAQTDRCSCRSRITTWILRTSRLPSSRRTSRLLNSRRSNRSWKTSSCR